MKLVKRKAHYHETELCHMTSRFVKLVEHSDNNGRKVHELHQIWYLVSYGILCHYGNLLDDAFYE